MKNALTVDDYLDHMRQALDDVDSAMGRLDRHGYERDRITQLAVQKAMENIGEAARQCSANYPAFAEREKRIPWSSLIG